MIYYETSWAKFYLADMNKTYTSIIKSFIRDLQDNLCLQKINYQIAILHSVCLKSAYVCKLKKISTFCAMG